MIEDEPSIPVERRELPVTMEILGVLTVIGRAWAEGDRIVGVEIDPVHQHRVRGDGAVRGFSASGRVNPSADTVPGRASGGLEIGEFIGSRGLSGEIEFLRRLADAPRRPDTLGFEDMLAAVSRMPALPDLSPLRDFGMRPPERREHPRYRVEGAFGNPMQAPGRSEVRRARKRERKARKEARRSRNRRSR